MILLTFFISFSFHFFLEEQPCQIHVPSHNCSNTPAILSLIQSLMLLNVHHIGIVHGPNPPMYSHTSHSNAVTTYAQSVSPTQCQDYSLNWTLSPYFIHLVTKWTHYGQLIMLMRRIFVPTTYLTSKNYWKICISTYQQMPILNSTQSDSPIGLYGKDHYNFYLFSQIWCK